MGLRTNFPKQMCVDFFRGLQLRYGNYYAEVLAALTLMLNHKSTGRAFPSGFFGSLDTLLNPIDPFPDNIFDQLDGLLCHALGDSFNRFMAEFPARRPTTEPELPEQRGTGRELEGRQRRSERYQILVPGRPGRGAKGQEERWRCGLRCLNQGPGRLG